MRRKGEEESSIHNGDLNSACSLLTYVKRRIVVYAKLIVQRLNPRRGQEGEWENLSKNIRAFGAPKLLDRAGHKYYILKS